MRETRAGLAIAAGAFAAAYYALFAVGAPRWAPEVALLLPPAFALVLHLRAAYHRPGRPGAYWRLTSLGILLWTAGAALRAVAAINGADVRAVGPGGATASLATEALFLGFLVPMLGAVAVRAHPRIADREPVALADAGLLAGAVGFVFIRLALLPLRGLEGHAAAWHVVLCALAGVLALWSATLWRRVREPEWKTAYGATALFAVLYGTFGWMDVCPGTRSARGTLADLGAIVPFFLLAAAAIPRRPRRPVSVPTSLALLLAGPGPIALEQLLRLLLQSLGRAYTPEPLLLLFGYPVLAMGCALRLSLEDQAEARRQAESRALLEEARRATRLSTLAGMSVSLLPELERATDDVVRRAEEAAAALGDRSDRVIEQAHRARAIVEEMRSAFRPAPQTRASVDVSELLHEAIHAAVDEGLPLHVAVEGVGAMPPVWADPAALGTAFLHLIRNAAQASPGGVLAVIGSSDSREITLRFADDGPGIPADHRHRIFDPFFTTRPSGEGVGLGLTQVHFVARDHGGSVVLEPAAHGASFALRLPIRERRRAEPVQPPWPLAAAVLTSALIATLLAVLPTAEARLVWSVSFQVASGLVAACALLWAADRERGRARVFWALLAAGPALWALTRCFRILEGGLEGRPLDRVWHFILYAAADLVWAAALLLRPDRWHGPMGRLTPLLNRGLALIAYAHFYTYLVVLPGPFLHLDAHLAAQVALVRGLERVALVVWTALLTFRTRSPYWRAVYGRLAVALGLWVLGQTLAGFFRTRLDYQGGALTDLGWIVPFLLLASLAVTEALRGRAALEVVAVPVVPRAWGSAAALLTLVGIAALAAVMPSSGHPALDTARETVSRTTVILLGVVLVVRELLLERASSRAGVGAEPSAARSDRPSSRLLRIAASALHQLSGHLSAIGALTRLIGQSEVPERVRTDAGRIQNRADAAARILRNVVAALPGSGVGSELTSLNALVEGVAERHSRELEAEGLRLTTHLEAGLPPVWVDAAAVQQIVLSCLDTAVLAVRREGRTGVIELSTLLEEDHLAVRVYHDGPGFPRSVLRELSGSLLAWRHHPRDSDLALALGREVAAQHGGRLTARNPRGGGGEMLLRLPRVLAGGQAQAMASSEASRTGRG